MTALTLQLLRKQRGLSLRALGREVGIDYRRLHVYERGLALGPSARRRLAEFFSVPESAL